MHSWCIWIFRNENNKFKEGFSIPVADPGMIINRKVFYKYVYDIFRCILNELESII